MPKKTKREKIIAEYRRKMKKWDVGSGKVKKEKISLQESQEIKNSTSKTSHLSHLTSRNTDLIKQDLKKTLILSTLAISFEFILYWFTVKLVITR